MPFVTLAAQVEPLKEQIRHLQNVQKEKEELELEFQQLMNEMSTLSEAFELRGDSDCCGL
jgi:hypothetical protein